MGLHIYFCDICGVRVTDVDLRSGHGLLRGQQVICGTCLGMGHGQSWLQSSAAATAPAADPADRIAAARDRAITVPDPAPAPRLDTKETVRVPTVTEGPDLAAVAQSLGAMGASSKPARDSLMDDVAESYDNGLAKADPSAMNNEHPSAPFVAPVEGAEESSALQPAVRSRSQGSSSSRRAAAVSASRSREPGVESDRRNPSKSASNRQTKSGRPQAKSNRTVKAAGGPPLPLIVTIIGVLLIATVAWRMINGGGLLGSQKGQVIDAGARRDQLLESVNDARKAMNEALESRNLAQLTAAHEKFRKAQEQARSFEDLVRTKLNWTEEQIETHLSNIRFEDLQSKDKAIRDELVRQHAP